MFAQQFPCFITCGSDDVDTRRRDRQGYGFPVGKGPVECLPPTQEETSVAP